MSSFEPSAEFTKSPATQMAWIFLSFMPGVVLIVSFGLHVFASLKTAVQQVSELRGESIPAGKKNKKVEQLQPSPSPKSTAAVAPLPRTSRADPALTEFLRQLSNGCFDVAAQLVRDMQGCGLVPLPCFYRLLFQHMARFPSQSPRSQWEELGTSRGESVGGSTGSAAPRDALSECYRVQYLARTGDLDRALATFSELTLAGLQADLCTVECLMVACLKQGRHDQLKELFNDLEPQNLLPTPVMFSVLISSYGQTGAVASSLAAFDQMKADYAGDPSALRLGYTSALHAAARNHRMGKAAVLFNDFEQLGLQLDATLVSILVTTAVQAGAKDLAVRVAGLAKAQQVQGLELLASQLLSALDGRASSADALAAVRLALS